MRAMKKVLIAVLVSIGFLAGTSDVHARAVCETGAYGVVTCREIPDDQVLGKAVPPHETVDAGLGDVSIEMLGAVLMATSAGVYAYNRKKAKASA